MSNLGVSEVKRSPKMGKIEHFDAFLVCFKNDILKNQFDFQWPFMCKTCISEHIRTVFGRNFELLCLSSTLSRPSQMNLLHSLS